jgi:hypothetical protein
MGHDISAYAPSGERITGPHFSRYWCPHYEYLECSHHNDGISGDGKSEDVTADQLRRALRKTLEELYRVQDKLEKFEDTSGESEISEWLQVEAETLEEFSEFLKTCIAEGVVKVQFW